MDISRNIKFPQFFLLSVDEMNNIIFLNIKDEETLIEKLQHTIQNLPSNSKFFLVCEDKQVENLYLKTFSEIRKNPLWLEKGLDCEPVIIFKIKTLKSPTPTLSDHSYADLVKLSYKLWSTSQKHVAVCITFDSEAQEIISTTLEGFNDNIPEADSKISNSCKLQNASK